MYKKATATADYPQGRQTNSDFKFLPAAYTPQSHEPWGIDDLPGTEPTWNYIHYTREGERNSRQEIPTGMSVIEACFRKPR